jgi:hypothetical protein
MLRIAGAVAMVGLAVLLVASGSAARPCPVASGSLQQQGRDCSTLATADRPDRGTRVSSLRVTRGR